MRESFLAALEKACVGLQKQLAKEHQNAVSRLHERMKALVEDNKKLHGLLKLSGLDPPTSSTTLLDCEDWHEDLTAYESHSEAPSGPPNMGGVISAVLCASQNLPGQFEDSSEMVIPTHSSQLASARDSTDSIPTSSTLSSFPDLDVARFVDQSEPLPAGITVPKAPAQRSSTLAGSTGSKVANAQVRFCEDDVVVEASRRSLLDDTISDDGESNIHFELADAWACMQQTNMMISRRLGVVDFHNERIKGLQTKEAMASGGRVAEDDSSFFQRLVMEPYSKTHICWELSGFVLLIFDLITIPLDLGFDPHDMDVSAMIWIIRIFWTFDIAVSFFTGYFDAQGCTVVSPKFIAVRYLKRQFHLDLLVVSLDYLELFISVLDGSAARALKSWRLLRIARVLRLRKARKLVETFSDFVYLDKVKIIVDILKMLLLLAVMLHLIACVWYAVGGLGTDYFASPSWIHDQNLQMESTRARYMYSFHFAIAIFSGEHLYEPSNMLERGFMVFVLFLSFLLQIYIVGSITTSMTYLEIESTRKSHLFRSLDRFLAGNNISRELTIKVTRNAMYSLTRQENSTREQNVELLQLISVPLKMELHFEMHIPVLNWHPFFKCYTQSNPVGVRKVCHMAVETSNFTGGDDIFHALEKPQNPRIFFVVSGHLQYFRDAATGFALLTYDVSPKAWLVEAVLWTNDWHHVGTLKATEDCHLLAVSAQGFQEVVRRFASNHARVYAEGFIDFLNSLDREVHSDIGDIKCELQRTLLKAFPELWPALRNEFGFIGSTKRNSKTKLSILPTLMRSSGRDTSGRDTSVRCSDIEHKASLEKRTSAASITKHFDYGDGEGALSAESAWKS